MVDAAYARPKCFEGWFIAIGIFSIFMTTIGSACIETVLNAPHVLLLTNVYRRLLGVQQYAYAFAQLRGGVSATITVGLLLWANLNVLAMMHSIRIVQLADAKARTTSIMLQNLAFLVVYSALGMSLFVPFLSTLELRHNVIGIEGMKHIMTDVPWTSEVLERTGAMSIVGTALCATTLLIAYPMTRSFEARR